MSVAFSPTATGAYSGTLTITCNGSSSPQTVSLSGTGSSAGTFSGRSTHDLTQSVTWSSTSATVATISNVVGTQGLATASAAGTTTIEAVKGKISGLTLLTVNPSLLSITLTPATSSIALGTRQQFTATGNYGDG
ncbi:MAG: ATP-dependent DNA ligase, partial [Acidobacteria bacterium]